MIHPWHASYPEGVPPTIAPPQWASLGELIEDTCRRNRGNAAVVEGEASLSYGQLGDMSDSLAAYLISVAGIGLGDRVALMMPNVLAYPISVCGVLRAAGVIVNVNPLYTPRELRHQLVDSGAVAIVVAEPFLPTLQAVIAETSVRTVIVARAPGGSPSTSLPGSISLSEIFAKPARAESRQQRYTDTAVIQYTGGTTGVSKGAELTHRNILSNLEQFWTWTKMPVGHAASKEVILTVLPMYHVFAFTVNFLSFLGRGSTNVLITNPRDLQGVVAAISREKVTAITGVNTLFNGLLNTPGFSELDFSGLRLTMGGGSAVQPAIARRWQQVTGRLIVEGYGLSETSPVLTVNPLDQRELRPGIGLPLPSTEISIRDDAGEPVKPGVAGELCARGPQVMRGYWNRPEESAAAFTSDGFFRTGDVAIQDDDGYFQIVDRKKDMVLVSGFNVYPNEIEAVCAEHPGVLESACVGVPDEKTGEAVKVFVVKRDAALTEQDLVEHCRRNLTGYKVPRYVVFLPELPKSPVGKILRRDLKDR